MGTGAKILVVSLMHMCRYVSLPNCFLRNITEHVSFEQKGNIRIVMTGD